MAKRASVGPRESDVVMSDGDMERVGLVPERIGVWIMNSKGGVGKTTLSVAIADLLHISDRPVRLLEIDTRKRLSSFMGESDVLSFEGAPPISEIRRNPNLVLKHYDPIMTEMEKGDCLLDMGANEDPSFLEYCNLSRIDEDLVDMRVSVVAIVPTVAETESVRGALAALDRVRDVVPSARRVLVLNERDQGDFDRYFDTSIVSDLDRQGVATVVMPKIISEGWDEFQRMKLRFIDIIGMDVPEIQEKFGWSRQFAKRARGDMAAWFEQMRIRMSVVLPIVED
jgi:hypothetical protein